MDSECTICKCEMSAQNYKDTAEEGLEGDEGLAGAAGFRGEAGDLGAT